MTLDARIDAFSELGSLLQNYLESSDQTANFSQKLINKIRQAEIQNAWFTPSQVNHAITAWAEILNSQNLKNWTSVYDFQVKSPKNVAIIMAGNIPLVGFHDFLSVLISGHKVLAKLSSNDKVLLPFLAETLIDIQPEFKDRIRFTENKLENFDAVIATGSNNTARYFEYYFKNKPSIIRKNRNSVAVLSGNESESELKTFGEDIFRYFGLGCRNVSKLFVPENYKFDTFFESIFEYKTYIDHHKYANNYDYNKAVYLMSSVKLLDNNFLILKEDSSYASPIGCLFYETYKNEEQLQNKLESDKNKIQCKVGHFDFTETDFGESQNPSLSDYADGVDTLKFLLALN
ncbi:acyl-CoA reductase [Psychroflexus aestuariivivens]|uniref:acyl-CoA reductase n=1 Tax=Psychroflexus aestuariivivens TaxID=1795040 RepID=UPI000FD82065|nr:acyl-CoA reductase [Psychroflexus aestuariivivens]